jgi:two-component system, chemotaxis family, chemotaxis protein CheY
MKILIVDDVPLMRKIMNVNLSKLGVHSILEAPDGEKAWKYFTTTNDIDAIFTDINMPNLDGLSFVKRIRDSKKNADVRIIAITGETDPTKIKLLNAMGVAEFINKPFDLEQFNNVARPVIDSINSGVKPESSNAQGNSGNNNAEVKEVKEIIAKANTPKAEVKGDDIIMEFEGSSITVSIDDIAKIAKPLHSIDS